MRDCNVPPDGRQKTGEHEDFGVGRGTVRIRYFDKDAAPLKRMFFGRALKKLPDKDTAFCDAGGAVFGERFYKDGRDLALFHMKSICLAALDGEGKDVVICSKSLSDCEELRDIILSFNVKILTTAGKTAGFRRYLAEEFGIADGAGAAAPDGKCVIVTENCGDFALKGAKEIINISGAPLNMPCITPKTLFFKPPGEIKSAPPLLKRCDYLQTALDFFGLSYENTKFISFKTCI